MGGSDGCMVTLRTVSVFVWLQEKAKDHQGAVLVTGLECGPQWCLCGYRGSLRDKSTLRMATVCC